MSDRSSDEVNSPPIAFLQFITEWLNKPENRKRLSLLVLLTIFGLVVKIQTQVSVKPFVPTSPLVSGEMSYIGEFSRKDKRQIIHWLKAQIRKEGHSSISVSIAKRRGIVFTAAVGNEGIPGHTNDPKRVVYPLGAVSKVFTSALLLALQDQGLISLDRPISDFLPDHRIGKNITQELQITPRLLATHLSGLPRQLNFPIRKDPKTHRKFDDDAFFNQLPALQFLAEPGSERHYSNLGFGLLGLAMENVTQRSYEYLLQSNILDPLGMKRTYVLDYKDENLRSKLARGFRCGRGCGLTPLYDLRWSMLSSNGLVSSSHDLGLLLTSLLKMEKNPIISPDSFQLSLQAQSYTRGDKTSRRSRNTVMWREKEIKHIGKVYRSFGGLPGSAAAMYYVPEHDIGVSVLSNRTHDRYEGGVEDIAETLLYHSIMNKINPSDL